MSTHPTKALGTQVDCVALPVPVISVSRHLSGPVSAEFLPSAFFPPIMSLLPAAMGQGMANPV